MLILRNQFKLKKKMKRNLKIINAIDGTPDNCFVQMIKKTMLNILIITIRIVYLFIYLSFFSSC